MHAWRELLPNSFPELPILCEPNAVVRPRGLRDPAGRRLPSGLFRPDGSAIDPAVAAPAAGSAPQPAPALPLPDSFRPGTWVYGGILLNHFGHVMIETGARLWAVQTLLDRGVTLDGVLFQRKKSVQARGEVRLPPTSDAFLSVFSPDLPVACAEMPEVVKTLYVPDIGISVTPDRFVGTPEQWAFFRDRAARVSQTAAPADIYVSRTGEGARGGLLFEAEIERVMAAAGYRIYHPQHHSIADQIATYRSARRLVSIDGSALHLAAAALQPEARVAVLARREFFAWAIADQLRAAVKCQVTVIDARQSVYNFAGSMASRKELSTVKGWSSSFALPDFKRLGQDLADAGFLDVAADWPAPTAHDIARELERAARLHAETLLPVPDDLLRLQPYFGAHLTATSRKDD